MNANLKSPNIITLQICLQNSAYKREIRISARDQQWIDFSLLKSTHDILSKSESPVLKSNYSDSFVLSSTLIYKYRLQWNSVQRWHQTLTIQNMFNSYPYSFRLINFEKYL